MKREEPQLYYGTSYMYLGGFIFKTDVDINMRILENFLISDPKVIWITVHISRMSARFVNTGRDCYYQ